MYGDVQGLARRARNALFFVPNTRGGILIAHHDRGGGFELSDGVLRHFHTYLQHYGAQPQPPQPCIMCVLSTMREGLPRLTDEGHT